MKPFRPNTLLSPSLNLMMPFRGVVAVLVTLGVLLMQSSCRPKPAESSASESAAGADVAQRAEAYLRAQAEAGFFNGAVLIHRGDNLAYSGAFGWADAKQAVSNTVSTRFRVASISKTFTAAVVLKLVEQGHLNLDTKLDAHLENCPAAWSSVTVHHLLTHTTGIPNYTSLPDFEQNNHAPFTPEQIVATFRDLPLEFETGEKHSYSNSNYLLLAMLVEKVSQRPLAEMVQTELLDPLGLDNTGFLSTPEDETRLAVGYVPDGMDMAAARPFDMSWLLGSGSMYSTVGDLQKWVQAIVDERIVTAETRQKMWQANQGPYGYGWQVLDQWPPGFGKPLVLHAGGLYGTATDLLYYPQEQITIAILANLETAPMMVIARDLSAIVFGADYSTPTVRKPVTVDTEILDSYVGDYQIAPGVTLTVRRDGDRLVVQATGQPADIAIPESTTRFFSRRVDGQLTFMQDAQGNTTHLVIQQNGQQIPAQRVTPKS